MVLKTQSDKGTKEHSVISLRELVTSCVQVAGCVACAGSCTACSEGAVIVRVDCGCAAGRALHHGGEGVHTFYEPVCLDGIPLLNDDRRQVRASARRNDCGHACACRC